MKTKLTLVLCALSLLAMGACKDKKDKKQKTPAAQKPTPEKPAPACPAGQVMDQGKCVTVVTPDKVDQVKKQAQALGVVAKTLEQFEKIEAPIAIVKLLMKTDAWKTAAKASKTLQSADEVVKALDATIDEIKKFSASATTGRKMLDSLVVKLSALQGGSAQYKSLADARKQLTDQLVQGLEPLAEQAKKMANAALAPAIEQIKKVVEYADAVCAIVKLSGTDDLKKQCKDVKGASDAAIAWIELAMKTPDTFVADLVKNLNTALGSLLDDKALDQLLK